MAGIQRKAYLVSVPSTFPADEYYDVLNAITEGTSHYYNDTDAPEPETTLKEDALSVFITHGEAYCSPTTQQRPALYSSISTRPRPPLLRMSVRFFERGRTSDETIYILTSSLAQGISDEAAVGPKYSFERVVLTTHCLSNYYQHARCYLCFRRCPPLDKVKSTTITEEAGTIHCPLSR